MKWITERDKQVLKGLYFHRYMTSSQIAKMFFKTSDKGLKNEYARVIARRRLSRYLKFNLIKSFFTAANQDKIHCLDEEGYMIVADVLGTTYNKLDYRIKGDIMSTGMVGHALALNDVYIELNEYGKVQKFDVEKAALIRYEYENKKYRLQPDAYLIINNEHYFVELDLNTESPKMFAEKVSYYDNYYFSGDHQRVYNCFPVILVICDNQGRIDRLKKAVGNTHTRWYFLLRKDICSIAT